MQRNSLLVGEHLHLCLCPKTLFERQPVAGGSSHYSERRAGLHMLPLAQISFDRPSEKHRHVIWFGGNVNIMIRKMEAEASTVGSCLGRQERSRDTG